LAKRLTGIRSELTCMSGTIGWPICARLIVS